jgi:hypothetical protein
MPTITVRAPRRFAMCAIARSEREANESITSRAVTSTMMPFERRVPARSRRSSRSRSTSESLSAVWIEAIR